MTLSTLVVDVKKECITHNDSGCGHYARSTWMLRQIALRTFKVDAWHCARSTWMLHYAHSRWIQDVNMECIAHVQRGCMALRTFRTTWMPTRVMVGLGARGTLACIGGSASQGFASEEPRRDPLVKDPQARNRERYLDALEKIWRIGG